MSIFPDKIKITITKDLINKGARSIPSKCAAALALYEQLPYISYVSVGDEDVVVYNQDPRDQTNKFAIYKTSKRLAKFIRDFDILGKNVQPSTFTLKKV